MEREPVPSRKVPQGRPFFISCQALGRGPHGPTRSLEDLHLVELPEAVVLHPSDLRTREEGSMAFEPSLEQRAGGNMECLPYSRQSRGIKSKQCVFFFMSGLGGHQPLPKWGGSLVQQGRPPGRHTSFASQLLGNHNHQHM